MSEIMQFEWQYLRHPFPFDLGADVRCNGKLIANFRDAGIAKKVVKGHNDAVQDRRAAALGRAGEQ